MAVKGSLQRYRVLASAALSVLFVCPGSVDAKGDLDRFELLGPVRTVVTKHSQLRTTQEFDPSGYLVALELHPASEPTSARYVFLHDKTGRLVEEHTFKPDGALAYKELFRYGFDDHGRQTALVGATDAGAFTHAELSMYDERGVLSEEIYITAHGTIDKSLLDISGNVIYQARYYQGRLVQETTHRYGPLGRLKESRYYGPHAELLRSDFYRYDAAGRHTEQLSEFHLHSHLRRSVVTFDLDHAGNWIKETIQRWVDQSGRLVLTETVVSRERTISYY